jgi:hypothetical protein
MRSGSERDIKKSEKRRDLPREERGRRAERCRDGALGVAGGGKWRGVADAWRCQGGQSPGSRIAELHPYPTFSGMIYPSFQKSLIKPYENLFSHPFFFSVDFFI